MAISQYSLDQDPNQVLHGLPLEHDPNQQQEGDEAISFVLPHWTAKRHLTGGNPGSRKESQQDGGEDVPDRKGLLSDWRLKSRCKTHAAALVICLNIAVDPPDVVKTKPCARLECWVDPGNMRADKALDEIGKNLQRQFETLSQKVRYKLYLDPAIEDAKKLCTTLRKGAKDERVLLYYNGHGVPAPTASGEIWVFNKQYTQYIPVSLYDLQEWLGSPCIFIWDCSAAGNIVNNFNRWAERRDTENAAKDPSSSTPSSATAPPTPSSVPSSSQPQTPNGHDPAPSQPTPQIPPPSPRTPMRDCIQLAACGPHETLPMTPELPADLFTSCLTSPIEMALRFYALQDPLKAKRGGATGDSASSLPRGKVTIEMVAKIPGELKDRRTPLGELNWIFTSVTDTIAWLVLPRDLFRRLFRHDLLVAALFRNFLLAERIMRNYNCTPRSEPPLPATYNHPLWDSWDATVEACLNQLPLLIRAEASARDPTLPPFEHKYVPSNFYVEHLTALDVWLTSSGVVSRPLSIAGQTPPALSLVHSERRPPVQLPIVLQVLLSQAHRLRALILLSKFVDLGSWAVLEALDIGVFPYVSRLLQSPAMELRPVLIFIWSRILAVDRSCQTDLLKENGFHYFASILSPYTNAATPLMIPNASEHRAMCAFILAVFCRDFRAGQQACLASDVFASCLLRLKDDDYLLRQWGPLCIAQLWDGNDEAKGIGLQLGGPNMLCQMLQDNSVEVRAAVLYALGTFFGCSGSSNPDAKGGGGSGVQLSRTERDQLRTEIGIATSAVLAVNGDASPMVRKELIIMLSAIVREWRGWFVSAAWTYWEQENCRTRGWDERGPKGYVVEALREWATFPREDQVEGQIEEDQMILSSCNTIFTALLEMSVDPYAEVATLACTVVDYITALLLDSAFMNAENSSVRLSQFVVSPKPGSPNQPRSRPSSALHTSANLSAPSPSETAFPFPSSNLPPSIARTQTGINHQHQSMSSRPSPKAKPSHLKRSHSFAARLMNLTGLAPPSEPESPHEDIEALPPPSPFGTAHYQAPYAVNRSSTTVDLPATIAVSSRPSTLGSSLPSSATFFKPLTSTTMTKNNTSDGESEIVYPPCTAAEVIHALAEEDMERLMIRRWAGSEAGGVPSGSHGRTNDLGIGHVAREVKDDVLPLKSRFFDWSCEYYTEPQMRQSEADEPGSVKYNEQLWRRERNEEIDKQAVISADRVAADILAHNGDSTSHPWTHNKEGSEIHCDTWPMKMSFHAFEDHLAVSDEHDAVCIYDWKEGTKLNRFKNGINSGTITSMYFINEVSQALLLTASSEGNVCLFRNYDVPGGLEVASAFRAVTSTLNSSHSSGIITTWDQLAGHLYVGGDTDYVRIWDAHREMFHANIPTQADSCITSLSAEEEEGATFVAGFGDGSVRLYDKRCHAEESLVRTYRKHRTWVQDVKLQQRGHVMVSGSMDGEGCVWDFRSTTEPVSEIVFQPKGLSALTTHSMAPFTASISAPISAPSTPHLYGQHPTPVRYQSLKLHFLGTQDPTVVTQHRIPIYSATSTNTLRPYAPWSNALAFHPKEMVIGVGSADSTIRIFSPAIEKGPWVSAP